MEEELRKLLSDEISREFKSITEVESGSKEQQIIVNNTIALYRLMLDDFKTESDEKHLRSEEKKTEEELRIKKKQYELDEAKYFNEKQNRLDDKKDKFKDNVFKWGIGIAELILPLTFYAIWMKRGFEFERTGTYTSTTFRGLFNNFKPIKK